MSQHDRWRVAHLVREAVKNVFDLRSRAFALVVFAVLAGTFVALFGAYESNLLSGQLLRDASKGRNVIAISAADPNHPALISRASCEGLIGESGVLRAGLLVTEGTSDYPQIGGDLPTFGGSATLFPQLRSVGVLIGSDLRAPVKPFRLIMPQDSQAEAEVGVRQPAGIDVNSSIVTGLSPSVVSGDTCYVLFGQYADVSLHSQLAVASLRVNGGAIASRQVFSDTVNPISSFANRPTRFLPFLIGLCGGLVGGILNRVRGSEIATYRLSGSSSRSVALILLFEQSLIAGLMMTAAISAVLIFEPYFVAAVSVALSAIGSAALWIFASSVLAIDVPFRRPTSLANDR